MKRINRKQIISAFVLLAVALSLALSLLARNVTCPVDDLIATWTGTSKSIDGVLMYKYRCPRFHEFWVKY